MIDPANIPCAADEYADDLELSHPLHLQCECNGTFESNQAHFCKDIEGGYCIPPIELRGLVSIHCNFLGPLTRLEHFPESLSHG